jgi:enamine deaminase RidA (YjgF/YER057c/UK114 family)
VISGTAALENGIVVYPTDIYRQTQAAIAKALAFAAKLGAEPRDVIRTRLLLAPGSDWHAAIRAHQEAFQGIDPANTTWFVGGFVVPGVLVEIELVAVVGL